MAVFEPNAVEHTFTTGRTFLIRRSIPMSVLLFKAIEDGDPELAEGLSEWVEGGGEINAADDSAEGRMASLRVAARITRTVIEAMFLEPRVSWDSNETRAERGLPPLPDGTIAVEDLHDAEMSEVVELAMASVKEGARFREESAGDNGGAGGEGVGEKPKRAPRAKGGKR